MSTDIVGFAKVCSRHPSPCSSVSHSLLGLTVLEANGDPLLPIESQFGIQVDFKTWLAHKSNVKAMYFGLQRDSAAMSSSAWACSIGASINFDCYFPLLSGFATTILHYCASSKYFTLP